jgi:hypothetical protein
MAGNDAGCAGRGRVIRQALPGKPDEWTGLTGLKTTI